MTIQIPSAFAPALADIISSYGETVQYTANNVTTPIKASVQSPASDIVVNDFQNDIFVLFIIPSSLEVPPKRFDKVVVRGIERSIAEAEAIRVGDQILVYRLVVGG